MNTKQLRQKILDIAIRGKLVPQDPADEPASALLDRISKEKVRLVREGKIKADKKAKASTSSSDKSHYGVLPQGWEFVRLGGICDFTNGIAKRNADAGISIPVLRLADLGEDDISFASTRNINLAENGVARYKLQQGDLLFVRVNGSKPNVGKTYAYRNDLTAAFCDHLIRGRVSKAADCDYIRFAVRSTLCRTAIDDMIVTTAGQNTISQVSLNIVELPLPPLAEQHRIVSAIESAFAVIDDIEQSKMDLQSAVTSAKSKILSLAVSGKLVPQDESDEPASVLLDRIRAERARLVKAGKIKPDKREKDAAATRDNSHYADMPFDVPKSWAWCTFGEVCDYGNCVNETPDNIPNDAWILDLEDIEKDTGRIVAFVSKAEREFYSNKHIFHRGQVLYSNLRPYLNKVLVAPKDGYCTSEIIPLKFDVDMDSRYVRYLLMSPYFLAYADLCSYGVKMPRLGATNAKKALIPLPPLNEQRRISVAIEAAFSQLDSIADELA
jgi:type I restriction enzyme S subunit